MVPQDIKIYTDFMIACNAPEEDVYTFVKRCQTAESGQDLMNIAEQYEKLHQYCPKLIYNHYIGWALPSKQVCTLVVEEWKKKKSRIIDLGAGTGLFSRVFHDLGVPEEYLLAVDIENPTHQGAYLIDFGDKNPDRRQFWPIHRDNDYVVDINDILFIAWGIYLNTIVEDYISRGGHTVIILGEVDGCTFPANYFEDKTGWSTTMTQVVGPASLYMEHLSINNKI